MKRRISKNNIILFFVIIIITCILKYPYLNEILENSEWCYKLIILYSNNNYINIIWLMVIIFQIFFITSEYYNRLISFDMRYGNRINYLNKIFKESIIKHILLSSISIFIQWTIFSIIAHTKVTINSITLNIFLKYIVEIYILSLIIIIIAILVKNYIYSFVYSIAISILCLISIKNFWIPFITLYYNYKFNMFNILTLMFLYIFIKYLYKKLDLGGIKNGFTG